jgi:peptidoglycan-N-acetylglucosamine deacetylase
MLNNRVVNIAFVLLAVCMVAFEAFGDVPLWLYVVAGVAYTAIQAYGSVVLSSNFFINAKSCGVIETNAIALTFDDGPIPDDTEAILDVLKERGVAATFFCIGHRAAASPDIVNRMHREGHLVGNHSYWHGKLFDLQLPEAIATELRDTNEVIRQTIKATPRFFRPPYGVTNPMVAAGIKMLGLTVVGWSIRSFDTVIKDPNRLFERVTSKLKAGDIILFHDYSVNTRQILPRVIEHANRIGLKVVRLDELIKEKAYV